MTRISGLSIAITGLIGVGVVAGGVAVITAGDPGCEPVATAGKASSLVSVEDPEGPGRPPVVDFPTPLITDGKEISTTVEGEGEVARAGAAVDFHIAAFLGANGQLLTASSFTDEESVRRVVDPESEDFFSRSLQCAQAGDRIVVTDTVESVFGPVPEDDLVQNDSTAVIVVDVVSSYLSQANGRPLASQSGSPMVVTHPEGFHGVTLPMGAPPEDLQVYTVKKGDGPPLASGDAAVVHFTGVVWETRQMFTSSFEQQTPLDVLLVDGSSGDAPEGVISGIYDGLVGQTVGSQVSIVVPPSAGYPEGAGPAGVPEGTTLVYVFDILGIR